MEIISSSSTMEYQEEEFYEEIEAPKFVDFTVPNHFSPDDRFWFCARVGCDRKHEEEMDPEAIYKNFVLRVMAARSPNVRFRRAISRKPISGSKKCPLSAPPKPAKSRLPRLALVSSSISKKLLNEENSKFRINGDKVKPTLTPKARVKHVAAKYMTSPRKKKGSSPNPNAFRSARNPMKTSVSIPKSKVVAKALVFNSPKKGLKKKKLEELGNTPITKLREGVKKLRIDSHKKGIARKSSKDCTNERKKLCLDGSRKVLSSCRVKMREIDVKFSRNAGCKAKSDCRKQCDVSQLEGEQRGGDDSDMEIDEKSRCDALEVGVLTGATSLDRDSDSSEYKTITVEAAQVDERRLIIYSITANDGENRTTVSEAGDKDKENEISGLHIESKEKNQKSDHNRGVISESEENADKENALNNADMRNSNSENLNKHNASIKPKVQAKKITQKTYTTAKENCPVETGKQVLKNRKLKTTNPKPFRLRTDERGILKEATTMERKANSTENTSTTSDNSQSTRNGVTEKARKKDENKSLKTDQHRIIESRYKTTKPPFLQNKREIASHVKSRKVCANRETDITMSRLKGAKNQGKPTDDPNNKASKAQKSGGQGKRTGSILREPKFHSLHKPKSCTKIES